MLLKHSLLLITMLIAYANIHLGKKIKHQVIPYGSTGEINRFKKISDIPLPAGYKRSHNPAGTFGEWLKTIDLKKNKTVYRFDGSLKPNQNAQYAVLDISVGKENLQQCADAVMRLRAEYLYSLKKFDEIVFIDNNRTAYKFRPPFTRDNFDKYLKRVFGMCGSASLSKQLGQPVEMKNINAGDVIIRGGFPGHAVIVMDVAINSKRERIYLLAQSYMPAQDIHILKNPAYPGISPWYKVSNEAAIITPEYTFTSKELKRW